MFTLQLYVVADNCYLWHVYEGIPWVQFALFFPHKYICHLNEVSWTKGIFSSCSSYLEIYFQNFDQNIAFFKKKNREAENKLPK